MKRYDFRGNAFRTGAVLVAALALLGAILRGAAARSLAQVETFTLFPGLMPSLEALCRRVGGLALTLSITMVLAYMVYWCIFHRVYWGFHYAYQHALLYHRIRTALLEAGSLYAVEGEMGRVILPEIRLTLKKDTTAGQLELRDKLKFSGKLENLNLSPALGNYRTTSTPYRSKDDNWVVYEFVDTKSFTQLVFDNVSALKKKTQNLGNYHLFLDDYRSFPLTGGLLCGMPGSGKSYTLYGIILQLMSWSIPAQLYFADPKNSGISVLGDILAPDRTAVEAADILSLLEKFRADMQERKIEMKNLLEESEELDSDYTTFALTPHVMIFDEMAAYIAALSKAEVNRVNDLLREIVLEGRQLGFFIWVVLQKAGADDIPTAIRNNLPLKVVLGNAAPTTYQVAFGSSANIPQRNFGPGEGLYSFLESEVHEIIIPRLNFPIVEAARSL